jgi:aminomuconate-semialdehyde/2-hydroxymuconate-6-semialdehyde dehydrogenase
VKGKIEFFYQKKKNFFFFSIISFTQHATIPNVISYTIRNPVGVAVLISPWNLPLYLLTWKIAPCIAFGCTCVCKPSEFTSITAGMLAQVFLDAGMYYIYVEYRGLYDAFN